MLKKPKILVVGSMVMDITVATDVFPNSGETVFGKAFSTACGGKGFNQAVQTKRLGADVAMVGRVGQDAFGNEMIEMAKEIGISTEHILKDESESTAIGNIILEFDETGSAHNRIIVVPGANMTIKKEHISFLEDTIKSYDMVILQLEIPMEINEIVADIAKRNNVKVMLNSAPYVKMSDRLLSNISFISPNEHEAALITGVKIHMNEDGSVNQQDLKEAVSVLLSKGIEHVIITLGENGAVIASKDFYLHKKGIYVKNAVDPTAAGDSFVGAFCTGISAQLSIEHALDFANYTASITVCHLGSSPSLPTIEMVYNKMKENKYDGFDIELLKALY